MRRIAVLFVALSFGSMLLLSCQKSPPRRYVEDYDPEQQYILDAIQQEEWNSYSQTAIAEMTLEAAAERDAAEVMREEGMDFSAPVASARQPQRDCPQGCIEHKSGCDIKGNVSFGSKEKIYQVPGQKYYAGAVVDPRYGERWFCTETEAKANGWRRSYE